MQEITVIQWVSPCIDYLLLSPHPIKFRSLHTLHTGGKYRGGGKGGNSQNLISNTDWMNVFSPHSDQIKANQSQTRIFAPPAEPERSHLDVALYRLHARLPSSPPSTLSSRLRPPSTSNLSPHIPLFAAESIAIAPPAEDAADARGAGGPTFKGAMQRVRPHADLPHQSWFKGVVPLISSSRGRFGPYVSVV